MQKRNKIIVGIDEVGRGPTAGPVIACAITVRQFSIFNFQDNGFPSAARKTFKVLLKSRFLFSNINVRDSKQMTQKQREETYDFLKAYSQAEWGIGRVGERVIDRINILEAIKLAMARAVNNLEKKLGQKADLLLIDGNFNINLPHKQQSIIKGDEKVPLIMLASIVAKVHRDKMMLNYHKKYPQYGFAQHKGYPTIAHREALRQHGACKIHRLSFKPVKEKLKVQSSKCKIIV